MATQYSHAPRPPPYPIPPPGWAPPFQGAPPPMPAGLMVNLQQWQMGNWQFNPAFNSQRYPAPAQVPWMPGPAWGTTLPQHSQQQQQGANFNPYKKVIKPPSAEYLATKLTNNGLDLHNMVPVQNRYGDEEIENIPKTPWIWNPATLSNDAVSVSAQNKTDAALADRSQIRHSSEPPPSVSGSSASLKPRHGTDPTHGWNSRDNTPTPSSTSSTVYSASSSQTNLSNSTLASPQSFTGNRELKTTFTSKIIRTPDHYSNRASISSTSSRDHSQGSLDSLTGRMELMNASDTPHDSAGLSRHSSMPSIHPNSSQHNPSISGVPLVDEPSSILSPLIMANTPRTGNTRPIGRGATYPDITGQPTLSTIAESPSPPAPDTNIPRRKSSSRHSPPENYARSASPSQDSFRRNAHRAELYTNSASPSIDTVRRSSSLQHTPPDTQTQETLTLHRSSSQHTPPDAHLNPIRRPTPPSREETPRRSFDIYAPSSPSQPASRKNSFIQSTSETYTQQTRRASSQDPSPPRPTLHYTPPQDATTSHIAPPPLTSSHTPHRPYPLNSHNHIFPEPPRSPRYTPPRAPNHPITPTSPRTYEEPRPEPIKLVNKYTPMPPPPGAAKKRRRVGYWNRRGDHCTREGYIVYAPPDQAYPPELDDYPEDGVGYQDGFGHIGYFDPRRPELPESLPRHGQPPVRPYSEFVKYEFC